jgi:lipid II:glycine glycyltransferase (peptidoglycan interpeptide bridge formation enzyme)
MHSIKVRIIDPKLLLERVKHYSQMVDSLKIRSIFQNPRWGLVMHESFDYDPYLLLLYDLGGSIVASLLFLMDKFTRRTLCLDGPCLDHPNVSLTDISIRAYRRVASGLGAERVEFRLLPGLETSERLQLFSFRAVKHIDKPLDDIWKSFSKQSHVRYGVRKAIRSGIRVYEAGKLKDYLDHIRLSYGSKIYGGMSLYDPEVRDFYKIIKNGALYLKNNHKLFLAELDGNVVATVLWLYDGHLAYYYDVGLDRRYATYCAPDYLMWYSIERLHALGIKTVDLMGLAPSSSRSWFKRKFSDEILPNKGFIASSPKFFIYYIRHYPYTVKNFRTYLQSMLRHKLLSLTMKSRAK